MQSSHRMNKLNSKFEGSWNADSYKKRREESAVELRKKRRNEHIAKKRALPSSDGIQAAEANAKPCAMLDFPISWLDQSLQSVYPHLFAEELAALARYEFLIDCLAAASDLEMVYHLVSTLRHILSSDKIPPTDFLFASGGASKVIEMLSAENLPLQKECIWCVINISSGPPEDVDKLLALNLVPLLVGLLDHECTELLEQSVWALGNLAGDSVYNRDLLLDFRTDEKIMKTLAEREMNHEQVSICVWTLSNLMRGKPTPPRSKVAPVIQAIPSFMQIDHEETRADCLWILSYASDGDNEGIQAVIDIEIAPMVMNLLGEGSPKLQIPALRTIGNITAGEDTHTDHALKLGLLDRLALFYDSKSRSLRKEALWTLSNVTAGTPEQIEQAISHPSFALAVNALTDADFEIKKEAVWVVSNFMNNKTCPKLALRVIEIGAFEPLCKVLEDRDPRILLCAMEAFNSLLRAAKDYLLPDKTYGMNEVALKFDEVGGLAALENLQYHSNTVVYEKAVKILQEHYEVDQVDDENQPPSE